MGKKNKAAKRLARYRAEAQQEVLNREIISKQTAEALYKLCLPILPEYIDDSQECDLVGREIVFKMGITAWNLAVTGRQLRIDSVFQQARLSPDEQRMIRQEIIELVDRKNRQYPELRFTIEDFQLTQEAGSVNLTVRLGQKMPPPVVPDMFLLTSEPEIVSPASMPGIPETLRSRRKAKGLSQIKLAEVLGVSVKKISAWEHGKSVPTAEEQKKLDAFI